MPPEAMLEQSRYNEKLDIFSLGVLMLEVATQQPPEVDLVGIGRDKEILRRREDLSKLEDDHPLKPLILSCLEDDPKERPDIVTVHTQLQAMVEGVEVSLHANEAVMFIWLTIDPSCKSALGRGDGLATVTIRKHLHQIDHIISFTPS